MQVKYDLGDWEKRKAALLPVLDAAAGDGLIARDQLGRLADFLLGRGIAVGAPPAAAGLPTQPQSLDAPIATEQASTVEESEAPRFIRGFHDVLITIGIVVVLLGLGGLATVYAVIPACIVLAEILVRRQRLALPAVVLTIAFSIACGLGIYPMFENDAVSQNWSPAVILATISVVTLLFFWRYKAPIALAAGFVSGYGGGVWALTMQVMRSRDGQIVFDHPLVFAALLGLYALLVFGTALRFDIADRLRLTRRSDVAFWMHLAAAPAILYTIMACVYLNGGQSWLSAGTTVYQAVAIVAAVLALMLIGIVLDRRAFVTSGLLSFGYAFKVILTEGGFTRMIASTQTLAFVVLLAVGIMVLSLGIGWQPLRRIVVGMLPAGVRNRLPPIRV